MSRRILPYSKMMQIRKYQDMKYKLDDALMPLYIVSWILWIMCLLGLIGAIGTTIFQLFN